MTIAKKAGGKDKNYQNCGSVKKSDVRPGMGYYNLKTHAMIIIDVLYDKNGNPLKLKVAESNYPTGNSWSNPNGQVPWLRTVKGGREVGFGNVIVDYEK